MAALQAQHEEALSENDHLRELLSKLQNEHAALQGPPFTFAVPKNAAGEQGSSSLAASGSTQLQAPVSITDATASSLPFPLSLQDGEIDWSALHVIDPSFVDVLDDHPQITATDFGFDYPSAPTTIASNPQYMSLADTFGAPMNSSVGSPSTNGDAFTFDIGYIPSWTEFPLPESSPDHDPLQEFLGGTRDPNVYTMTSSDSPVQHTAIPSISTPALTSRTTTPSNASLFNTPRESTTTIPEEHEEKECPKTKEELRRKIAEAGSSTFVEKPLVPMVHKKLDPQSGLPSVGCDGANLPLTKQSENNVEVMAAWKRITSHPNFKVRLSL